MSQMRLRTLCSHARVQATWAPGASTHAAGDVQLYYPYVYPYIRVVCMGIQTFTHTYYP